MTERRKHEPYGERFNPYKMFNGSFVPDWLGCREEMKAGPKLCYGRLMRYAGKDGRAFPRHKALATALGVSVTTSQRYVSELKKHRLIETKQRGLTLPNDYYFLRHPWMDEVPEPPLPKGLNGQTDAAGTAKPGCSDLPTLMDTRESEKRDSEGLLDKKQEEVKLDIAQLIQEKITSDSEEFPFYDVVKANLSTKPSSLGSVVQGCLRPQVEALLDALGVRADQENFDSRFALYQLITEVVTSDVQLLDAMSDACASWNSHSER